ncbi:unnamed protein product [Musa banksii]
MVYFLLLITTIISTRSTLWPDSAAILREAELPQPDLKVCRRHQEVHRLHRLQYVHHLPQRPQPQLVRPLHHPPQLAHLPLQLRVRARERLRQTLLHRRHLRTDLQFPPYCPPLELVDPAQLRRAKVAQVARVHAQEEVRQLRLEPEARLGVEEVDECVGAPPSDPVGGTLQRGGPWRGVCADRVGPCGGGPGAEEALVQRDGPVDESAVRVPAGAAEIAPQAAELARPHRHEDELVRVHGRRVVRDRARPYL